MKYPLNEKELEEILTIEAEIKSLQVRLDSLKAPLKEFGQTWNTKNYVVAVSEASRDSMVGIDKAVGALHIYGITRERMIELGMITHIVYKTVKVIRKAG